MSLKGSYSTFSEAGYQPIVARRSVGAPPSVSLQGPPSRIITSSLRHGPMIRHEKIILWRSCDTDPGTEAVEDDTGLVTGTDESRSLAAPTVSTFGSRPLHSPALRGPDGRHYQVRYHSTVSLRGIPPGVQSLVATPRRNMPSLRRLASKVLPLVESNSSAAWPVVIESFYDLHVADPTFSKTVPRSARIASVFSIVPMRTQNSIAPSISDVLLNRLVSNKSGFGALTRSSGRSRRVTMVVQDRPDWLSYLNKGRSVCLDLSLSCSSKDQESGWQQVPRILLAPNHKVLDLEAVGSMFKPRDNDADTPIATLVFSPNGGQDSVCWSTTSSASDRANND